MDRSRSPLGRAMSPTPHSFVMLLHLECEFVMSRMLSCLRMRIPARMSDAWLVDAWFSFTQSLAAAFVIFYTAWLLLRAWTGMVVFEILIGIDRPSIMICNCEACLQVFLDPLGGAPTSLFRPAWWERWARIARFQTESSQTGSGRESVTPAGMHYVTTSVRARCTFDTSRQPGFFDSSRQHCRK